VVSHLDVNLPSPVYPIETTLTVAKGINLYIKRDDLIHPLVSGNKWRKLKYNLEKIKVTNCDCAITFGGAFSNHIHATAAACFALNIPSAAIIRGEIDLNNPTLKYCMSTGMKLYPIGRTAYQLKENAPEVQYILSNYQNPIIIPEGGTNELALRGVAEIIDEVIVANMPVPDIIVLAAGTGGTTAGLMSSSSLLSKIIAISSLKSEHLYDEILKLVKEKNKDKLTVLTDYHFGGYAKWDQSLLDFITSFEKETDIALDHVYNGKAMYALMDMIANGKFAPKTTILYLHTGGLQGKNGLEYMLQKKRR
jgi:1-aminocyclopropane-1-carboxylate deaminase